MNYQTFSIIVGIYNHRKTLPKLVEALMNQKYQDFDVHFCDDGSTDGGMEWLKENIHPILLRRCHFHTQKNRGMRLAKNLNQGIKAAHAEYCVFIMGDSFPENDYLWVLRDWLGEKRILCGVRYQVDGDKGVDIDWRLKRGLVPQANVLLPVEPWDKITGNGMVIPTKAMREHGGWNETIKGYGGDDNEIVARLYYLGYTVFSIVDAKLYHNWHQAIQDNPKNNKIVNNLIQQYASSKKQTTARKMVRAFKNRCFKNGGKTSITKRVQVDR